MGTWRLYTLPQEAATCSHLLHCPVSSPSTSHLAASTWLPWRKLVGEDHWRVKIIMSSTHGNPNGRKNRGKTTNSSNIFFLLTPMGSSHLSMRETPDETTPGCSAALHHTPSHQGCSRNHRSPHSPSLTASAATSHPSDVSPKSRCVQRAGGLLEYRGHFSTV